MKPDINNRRKTGKFTNKWKLNNISKQPIGQKKEDKTKKKMKTQYVKTSWMQ